MQQSTSPCYYIITLKLCCCGVATSATRVLGGAPDVNYFQRARQVPQVSSGQRSHGQPQGPQLPRARPAASLGTRRRVIPAGRLRVVAVTRLWGRPARDPGGRGRPCRLRCPAGKGPGRPGFAPGAPCPGRAEPSRLCLRGISGAKRSSAADPGAGPQPGRGPPQEEEEGEAEARWLKVARPLPPRRGWLCGHRRLRCG